MMFMESRDMPTDGRKLEGSSSIQRTLTMTTSSSLVPAPLQFWRLIVGCGINTTNPHPTTSLLNIIPETLTPPTHERLLANILSTFSDMYSESLRSGFQTFDNTY